MAIGLTRLAQTYHALRRLDDAGHLFERALAIREKELPADHPDVGTSLNNLAALYASQGRYAQAEPLYKRALELREKALAPDHPDIGTTLNTWPNSTEPRAAPLQPSRFTSVPLSSSRRRSVPTTPMSARDSTTWPCCGDQGRYAEAEPLSKRALSISEKALGADHPHIGTGLNNLAALYGAQGRYAEAEPLSTRALSISEKALGPDHHPLFRDVSDLVTHVKEEVAALGDRLIKSHPDA